MASHSPRYVPPGGALVEITYRTLHGRFLLRPCRELDRLVVGALAVALTLHPGKVGVVGIVVLSNHLHLLLAVEDQHCLSELMQFFGGQAAREINRLQGWSGTFWDDRYTSICVTTEERAQVARLEYLLAQGVKEGLVERVSDWPGLHFGKTLLEGRSLLAGVWIDRTKLYRAGQRGKTLEREEYVLERTVELRQLPCWNHLPWGEYLERIEEIVERIEARAALEREAEGRQVLGPAAVLAQDPLVRPGKEDGRSPGPDKLEKRPAPRVHAASEEARTVWRKAFGKFLEAYREASERLRRGEVGVTFPEGCFPPGSPYVWPGGTDPPESGPPARAAPTG